MYNLKESIGIIMDAASLVYQDKPSHILSAKLVMQDIAHNKLTKILGRISHNATTQTNMLIEIGKIAEEEGLTI